MIKSVYILALLIASTGLAVAAVEPPALINYQGVLRGADDVPKNGDFDITFRLFDAPTLGNEILVDAHTDGGFGAVTVTGGLFSVPIGSGIVTDGAGPGVFLSLTPVFQSFSGVWLEIEIEGETLAPRVRVLSAAYALNAGSLGGSSAGDFLMSNASDTYANGTLTLDASSVLDVNGEIRLDGTLLMNPDGPEGPQSIYFYAFGEPAARSLAWNPAASRFEFNDTVRSTGNLTAGGTLAVDAPTITINADGPDGDQSIGFFNGVSGGETLGWDSAQSRFELTDELAVGGALRVGSNTLAPVTYNTLGTGTPDSGAMGNTGDLYVTFDLEVDSLLFLNGELRMDDDGPESSQEIYFYEDGLPTGESIAWNDALDAFTVSDDLDVNGPVSAPLLVSNNIDSGGLLNVNSDGLVTVSTDGAMRFQIDGDGIGGTEVFEWFESNFTPAFKLAEFQQDGDVRIAGTLSQNVAFDVAESFLMGEPLEPGDLVGVDPSRPDGIVKTRGEGDRLVLGVVSESPGVLLGDAPFSTEGLKTTWGEEVAALFHAEAGAIRQAILQEEPELAAELAAIEAARSDGAAPQAEELAVREQTLDGRLEGLSIERFFARRFAPVALAGRVPVKVDGRFGAIATGDALAPSPIPGVAMKASGPGPIVGTALEAFSGGAGRVTMFVQRGSAEVSQEGAKSAATLERTIAERTPDPATGTQALDGNLQIVLDRGGDDRARFSLHRDGESTIGAEVFRVDEEGNVWIRGSLRPSSMDLAEYYPVSEPVEPGDVLIVDRENPGAFRRSLVAGDSAVVGIVSEKPGVLLGSGLSRMRDADPDLALRLDSARAAGDRREEARLWSLLEDKFQASHAALALSGNVRCKVDASSAPIRAGDLLTTSSTPGHAMRSDDPRSGTIIGKALEPLNKGTGAIRVLVMLR